MIPFPFQAGQLGLAGQSEVKFFEMLFEGSNGSTTFTETFGKTVSVTGGVTISTAQFADGSSSGSFPGGTADYLSVATSTDFDFGTQNFSIRVKVRPATVTGIHMIATTRASAGSDPGFLLWQNATQVRFLAWGPTAGTSLVDITGGTLALNTWAALEVRRTGGSFNLLQDGAVVASGSSTAAIVASTNALNIGRDPSTNTRGFNGYMDTFQMFKG